MKNSSQVSVTRACSILGGQAALAGRLGVTPAAVNQWIKGLRPVPSKHCPKIEEITGGSVRCEELLPSFNWESLRARPSMGAPHRATDPVPAPGHAGRQPPTTNRILDTVPDRAAVGIDARAIP